MSSDFREIEEQAKSLPPEERARLAESLLESLQQEGVAEVAAAWSRKFRRALLCIAVANKRRSMEKPSWPNSDKSPDEEHSVLRSFRDTILNSEDTQGRRNISPMQEHPR